LANEHTLGDLNERGWKFQNQHLSRRMSVIQPRDGTSLRNDFGLSSSEMDEPERMQDDDKTDIAEDPNFNDT
jgi:hypothetical protein